MPIEIERKFLVRDDSWRAQVESSSRIVQGYLGLDRQLTVRVRLRGDAAFLTLKGGAQGIRRSEFEYPIPPADALAMLDTLGVAPAVDKVRHLIRVGGHLWELDVFAGENAGLVMAEIELNSEGEAFERPDWLGDEVSEDPRYYNASLARYPFRRWR
jgi:adenylate cyclase